MNDAILEDNRMSAASAVDAKDLLLKVEGVSKRFCRNLKRAMYYGVSDIGKELVGLKKDEHRLRKDEFWALDNVSFELRKGEAIGLVGANGAGKTTLLKVISGLIKPDQGRVKVIGRLAPLIALGAGFNPILSGRENIFINMSILGLSQEEIEKQYDAVIEFAEIGHAINAPVSTYSSGMAARLGFSCAIHTNPDILLLDEVLAVGDMKFRTKCYRKLAQLRQQGTCFVLVSHSTQSILSVCNIAIYMKLGKLVSIGEAEGVMEKYENELYGLNNQSKLNVLHLPDRTTINQPLSITYINFVDNSGQNVDFLLSGFPLNLKLICNSIDFFTEVNYTVIIRDIAGENEVVLNLSSEEDDCTFEISPGENTFLLKFPYCGLKPGSYNMKLYLNLRPLNILDVVESFKFSVASAPKLVKGIFYQYREWKKL